MWHVTRDMWHVTCDMWHVTCDRWHVTCLGGWTFSQIFSSLALTVCDLWNYEDLEEKDRSLNELINDEAVYRTAPATPGLLNSLNTPLPDVLPCPEILQWTLSVLLSLSVLGRTPWSYQGCKIRLNPHFLPIYKAIHKCLLIASIVHGCWVLKILESKLRHFFSSSATADFGKLRNLAWQFLRCSSFSSKNLLTCSTLVKIFHPTLLICPTLG